jgi:hypothetical protein
MNTLPELQMVKIPAGSQTPELAGFVDGLKLIV